MKLLVVCTTVGQVDDARRIATAAVGRGLAACVHIDAIESVYRWQGAVQQEHEQRLMFKTTEAAAPALRSLILAMHPYELPALYSLDVGEASAAYADWVIGQAGGASAAPADPASG
ncbi:MAG: divalent-cation tolerance protein CutA [Burkholderiales bacterium]|nr:divalent-cation tolerance protein CutA [Burkholderiales bacterium]